MNLFFKLYRKTDEVFSYFHIGPLYIIIGVILYNNFSMQWLINLLVVFILYQIIWWASFFPYTYFEIKSFFNEFILNNLNFNLAPSGKELEELIKKEDFGYVIKHRYDLERLNKNVKKSDLDYENFSLINSPLLFFRAIPIGNQILGSCKAYVYNMGAYFIVNRTSNFKNDFEKFLFYHELSHVDDIGMFNFRSNCRWKTRFYFHLIFLTLFITNIYAFIAYLFYLIMLAIHTFVLTEVKREIISDNYALSKLSNHDSRLKVINLIIKNFESIIINKNIRFDKISIAKERLSYMRRAKDVIEIIKKGSLENDAVFGQYSYVALMADSGPLGRNIEPKFKMAADPVSHVALIYLLFQLSSNSSISASLFLIISLTLGLLYLLLLLYYNIKGFSVVQSIYSYLNMNYSIADFVQPFTMNSTDEDLIRKMSWHEWGKYSFDRNTSSKFNKF